MTPRVGHSGSGQFLRVFSTGSSQAHEGLFLGVSAMYEALTGVRAEARSLAWASRLGDETLTTLGRLPFLRVGIAALGATWFTSR
jgi:hypothetical protein